jgi:uracil-DNA glycosylase
MNVRIDQSWKRVLNEEFEKEYFIQLTDFIREEYKTKDGRVFPPARSIFNAFDLCPFDSIKVIILGQDPYPTRGHANGLCFSVQREVSPLPRSLNNIYKELKDDVGMVKTNGCLEDWSSQGVFLLNTILTVEEGKPGSHATKGWEQFTDAVLKVIAAHKKNVVFLLWGSWAQKKRVFIDEKHNLVIQSVHPSPLSAHRGFFGSKPFSQINQYLVQHGMEEIKW